MIPVCVMTIGTFDGFHRGHRAVLERAQKRADRAGARVVAITFDPHPRSVLSPENAPLLLTPVFEKVAQLRSAGADEVRVLRFTPELAARSPQSFLGHHIFPHHRILALVSGYDFAMGRDRRGTLAILAGLGRKLGFETESVQAVLVNGTAVSSRRIRTALTEGDLDEARRCLGRPYRLAGRVVTGDGRGRTIGFPTANISIPEEILRPIRGVYAVRVRGAGLDGAPGVANLGRRPTFDGVEERLEVHLLDYAGVLTGGLLYVDFVRRLRPEVKFNNSNELTKQIRADIQTARRVLVEPSVS